MKRKHIALLSIALIAGCAVTGSDKIFVGIPFFAGVEGSEVRLDDNWILSAGHNKVIYMLQGKFDAIYHPTCDLVLIPEKGVTNVKLGTAYHGDEVFHTGYPMISPYLQTKGRIIGDAFFDSYPGCVLTMTTGKIKQGMSGGGVYNDKGELIGINHGYSSETITWPSGTKLTNGAAYLHLKTVRNWLKEHTGKDYWK